MSGLGFGSKEQDLMSLQLLVDLVTGELGTPQVNRNLSEIWRKQFGPVVVDFYLNLLLLGNARLVCLTPVSFFSCILLKLVDI